MPGEIDQRLQLPRTRSHRTWDPPHL